MSDADHSIDDRIVGDGEMEGRPRLDGRRITVLQVARALDDFGGVEAAAEELRIEEEEVWVALSYIDEIYGAYARDGLEPAEVSDEYGISLADVHELTAAYYRNSSQLSSLNQLKRMFGQHRPDDA